VSTEQAKSIDPTTLIDLVEPFAQPSSVDQLKASTQLIEKLREEN